MENFNKKSETKISFSFNSNKNKIQINKNNKNIPLLKDFDEIIEPKNKNKIQTK